MQWIEEDNNWQLINATVRTFEDSVEKVTRHDTLIYEPSEIVPQDLLDLEIMPEEMNYTELDRFIDKMNHRFGAANGQRLEARPHSPGHDHCFHNAPPLKIRLVMSSRGSEATVAISGIVL